VVDRSAAPAANEPAGAAVAAEPADGGVLAFIDIGTNSVRLMVVELHGRSWSVLTQQKETVRLGEGEFGDRPVLLPEAMDRTVAVGSRFAELARAHGAQDVVAVTTAAVREAENREAFLRRMREEAGLLVHVVSGPEEARLIFLGVLTRVRAGDRRLLVVDIGGGSTELARGDAVGAHEVESLRLGAIRLTAIAPSTGDGKVPGRVYRELRRQAELALAPVARRLGDRSGDDAFGTSGSIVNLAAVAARTLHDESAQAEQTLTRGDLRKVAKMLRDLPLDERRAVPALNPDRADIVVAGAAILETVMDGLGLTTITAIAGCGLREGLLMDYLARHDHLAAAGSVRERSVLHLAQVTGGGDAHSLHVAGLAEQLFDSARAAGLHTLGARSRELLRYAALLHDIGVLLSYEDHHRHTHYLIRNADLLGFDQEEIAVMAAAAFFHRKGAPRARHEVMRTVDPGDRETVRWLSLFLRLAEVLDRGHAGAVAEAALSRRGAREVLLTVHPARDWRLEEWGLRRAASSLRKTLRRELRLLVVEPDGASHDLGLL
jgi:exopolyphosphatase / guanosine-5'-triphosphate,3'-diphosphate pyrophosphatase